MADRQRLMKLLEYHRKAAESLAFALSLMNGDEKATKAATVNGTLAAALQIDEARRVAKKPKPRASKAAEVRAQRQNSAKQLDRMSTTEPRPWRFGRGVATFMKYGYLKRAGSDGRRGLYLRTAKPFSLEKED